MPLTSLKLSLLAAAVVATPFWGMSGCSQSSEAAEPPAPRAVPGELAFPGAIGHGAASRGGRGGRIIYVDTLADQGPGTLRACMEAQGRRTCIFRVNGVIRFAGRSPAIRHPYLTIAGHTAPGSGIIVANTDDGQGRTPIIVKDTHDVVIRHLRVRLDAIGADPSGEDAFTIENSRNVILDHVSGSWARDELVNPYGENDRITISWSLFAEAIPPHDKCALLGSDPKGPQNVSFIFNLCAHSGDRNPDINFKPGSCVEVINNLFYNANSQFAEIWESYGGSPVSLLGNFFKSGPNTAERATGIERELIGSKGMSRIFVWGNKFDGRFVHVSPQLQPALVAEPPCPATVRAASAEQAYRKVLAGAGAFPRDRIDGRIVEDVRTRRGRIVRQPGRIEAQLPAAPYVDADRDGMDDGWERRHGSDPTRSDPWADADADGLLNLDQFLDHRHRELVAAGGS